MIQWKDTNEPDVKLTLPDGSTKTISIEEADAMGLTVNDIANKKKIYTYKDAEGNTKFTKYAYEVPSSISLDTNTGNIKLTAPKAVTDLPEFQEIFKDDVLKTYSKAYKLNPDYKVKIQEYNQETGQSEEKDVTIPEWVEKANSSLKNFMENLGLAEQKREVLRSTYGDKVDNLTYSQIQMSEESDNYTYIPEIIKNVNFFGDDSNKGNPFSKILNKLGENGEISYDDLKEIYNKDNFGRSELAGLLATIDGALKQSGWDADEYYKDADGNDVYNRNSAKEASKLLAFRDFVVSHHPDGEWWQEVGTNIETLSTNFMYGATRYFKNIQNVGEFIFTGGQGTTEQDYIKSMDETMDFFNQTQSLESESTQLLATLGLIGGTFAAGWAGGAAVKGVTGLVSGGLSSLAGKAIASGGGIVSGSAAAEALSAETMSSIVSNASLGARIAMSYASLAEKMSIASGVYHAFMEGHTLLNWSTSFLMDTLHDALVYDSTTLRDVISNADDENMRNYWLGQLADNAKWWGGMAFAKSAIKFSGKTTLGKAVNIWATRLVNRVAAGSGKLKAAFKDKIYGGDVARRLQEKIDKAISDGHEKTAKRLKTKLEQERWNSQLREARSSLAKMKLDWKNPLKLTEESSAEYKNALARIKALEISIDKYHRNIEYQRQTMVGLQYDPSTGKMAYINPDLGRANNAASSWYVGLSDLEKKAGLVPRVDSLISSDSIDYMMGKYHESLLTAFAKGNTENAADAAAALPIVQGNLARLAERLPEEITNYIDKGIQGKIYQNWYFEQNAYGMAKGLVDRQIIESYQNNPIWKEAGYMPIVKELGDSSWKIVDKEGKIAAKIEQDFREMEFKVEVDQHYVDPELTRQSRLSDMAQAEVNKEIFKAYGGYGSNATNITMISGEETEYARILLKDKEYLENQVKAQSVAAFQNPDVSLTKVRRRKPIKYSTVSEMYRDPVVASLPMEDINDYLVKHGVIDNSDMKFTDKVSAENYEEWFKSQNSSVKKFLAQQYQSYNPDRFGTYTQGDILSGKVDTDTRTRLAQAVVDRSNGEKILAWRSQSTGVDDFYDSAGGTGTFSDAEIAKWKGGRWTSLGGDSWSIGGYGDQKLAFPVNRSDILSSYDINEYADTANELYKMKYGSKLEKELYAKTYVTLGKNIEDIPHYSELSELKKADLKKIVDEDPRALLDISGKKIINYDGIAGREWVIFPDRNPELLKNGVKEMSEFSKTQAMGTFEDLQTAIKEGGDDFDDAIKRAFMRGDKEFIRSPLMNEGAHNLKMGRDAFYQGTVLAEIKSHLRNVKRIDTSQLVDDMSVVLREQVESYVLEVLGDKGARAAINRLSETTDASGEFGRYIALRRLQESGMDNVYKTIDAELDKKMLALKDIDGNDMNTIKNQMHKMVDEIVESELDEAAQVVRTTNPELVDAKSIYDKAKTLDEEITRRKKELRSNDSDYVMYLDDEGRQVFAEVDPAFASLFNYRYKMDKTEASVAAKVNAAMSKVFRFGTTSVNLSSFGNQLFRDFGNALLIGGSWHTIKTYRKNLVDVFGNNIVEQIGRFDPDGYEMKQLEKIAEANNQTLAEAAVSRELMKGAAISPTTTERTLYKTFYKDMRKGADENSLVDMRNKFQKLAEKLNPDDILNGKRENYLRNRVYASSYYDAMKNGYTVEQSRVFAEFAMNNATTNFSRQVYHLQAIADSTPYFRAAINGTKSFWRMWSLDPVGITGRVMGGLVLPVMYLTGASLGSEENRKVYENIPEYQKQNSLIFVINGKIVSVPIPQELGAVVAPFRQFVEYLYDTNKNDFWELMMNDVLGFFPYDLQGFSTIDMDQMISDPTIFDRISRGVSKVFAKMAPVPVKSAYMLATGVDPYTGKNLKNPAYSYWNDETGQVETLDYDQNSFAKWFASIPFIKGIVTPELAEKIFSGVVGTTGSDLLGDIAALFANGPDGLAKEGVGNIEKRILAPFNVQQYDLTNAIWNRAVKQMTAEKNAILNSNDMKKINSELSKTDDPDKRKELLAARQNLVNDYQQKVGDMVKRLDSVYHGTFDKGKFSAVIQLLNFNTDAPYQAASQYASDLASDLYWEGRDAAIQTMRDLGVEGVQDTSIFGYLTQDKEGNVVVRYSSPVAILDMANSWGNQADYHLANIKALVSENDLWNRHSAMKDQINAIYSKPKLSDSDYDQIDAIYVNWNAEVMAALAPYIETMTPEAAINNYQVMDYLDGLIEVPGDYKKDKYGRYVTNSKLGKGNANDAYISNYIKNIFRINDTGYKGGRNYSSRKTYDKENKRWR